MNNVGFCGRGAVERLETFGWNAWYETHLKGEPESSVCPARVVSDLGESYRLMTEHGELKGEIAGRLRHAAGTKENLPAVGDWVIVDPRLSEGKAVIRTVLPRRSRFIRKEAGSRSREQIVAANIETAFVVVGLDNDFNPRRIERYVTAIWDSGATPVVLLTKTDLCSDVHNKLSVASNAASGATVHALNGLTGDGIAELERYLVPGQTVALMGSSGAGKSTLINRLFGSDIRRIGDVRESDDRGKHTTSTRDLILLPGGALVIDTPGMRELQFWRVEGGLKQTFEDVESLAQECRFADCSHRTEPDCAVREAVEAGTLDRSRIESFKKLQKEIDFLDLRRRYGAQGAERKRWKRAMKLVKTREERDL